MSWLSSIFASLVSSVRSEDADLLERIADGDRAALRKVYNRVSSRAMAVALRILKDRADAEDVVQETFVELWRRASQFDVARGTVNAWVVTIARNRALDRLRARQTSDRTVAGVSQEPVFAGALPNEAAEEQRERLRVVDALARLPMEQRQVIELAYFEGLTQTEIATHTREPLGTVKTRVRLAMGKLSELLAQEAPRNNEGVA